MLIEVLNHMFELQSCLYFVGITFSFPCDLNWLHRNGVIGKAKFDIFCSILNPCYISVELTSLHVIIFDNILRDDIKFSVFYLTKIIINLVKAQYDRWPAFVISIFMMFAANDITYQ